MTDEVTETPVEESEPEAPAPDDLLAALAAERDEYLDLAQRVQADFENYRKRAARDQERLVAHAHERLVRELLPVLDDLERALEAAERHEEATLVEGVRLVQKALRQALSDRSSPAEIELVRSSVSRYDAVIASVFVRTSSGSGRMDLAPPLVWLLSGIAQWAGPAPFVVCVFGNPYTAIGLPEMPAILLTYDISDHAEAAAVRALCGEAPIGGKLPIALPGFFPRGHGLERPAKSSAP